MKNQKLWAKKNQASLHPLIEAYTIGNDYLLDMELVPFDIQGSVAHAKMLNKIGLLRAGELSTLLKGFDEILTMWQAGKFVLKKQDEDCHSAMEFYLTENFGEVGKKIHTGRSRNDQVLVTMRLYAKAKLNEIFEVLTNVIATIKKQVEKYRVVKMPGYTHMQPAMPSTVGQWLESYQESLQDDVVLLVAVQGLIDQNPLGSAAGFGVPVLEIDREFTTSELGFARTQNNPMYCALSRGKFENILLQALGNVVFDLGKFASDLLLFATKEFGFFDLPAEFKTGSSIMPQKNNFDVLELIRANVSVFYAQQQAIQDIIKNLPSGYNRDFQLTKEPFMKGIKIALEMLAVFELVVRNLIVYEERLNAACATELYATERVYEQVKQGASFRDAYRVVGGEV